MSAGTTVIVLAKAPVPGRVKTRLCPPATAAEAADLAAAALLDTLDAIGSMSRLLADPLVVLDGSLRRAARARQLRTALAGVPVLRQRGGGLGARIAAAHADVAALRPGQPTLLLGMDTPQVDAALLVGALDRLRSPSVDAVLGPATDGGWWLLGLRDPRRAAAVAGVPTSRADTGERTLAALRGAGLRVGVLAELTDVDTAGDAVAVARQAPGTRFAAAVGAMPAFAAAAAASGSGIVEPAGAGVAAGVRAGR